MIDAFKTNDKAKLKPIADFWNTGFDADQLPTDPSLYLSSGPYKVTSYAQRANLTLERNPDYNWGPIPAVDKISYSIIGDPTAAVQALTNEEIDVISPQATADIYQAVSGLKDRGIEVKTGDGGTYEHVDLVFANGGPFDPATYGGDAAKALAVRTAFLKTVPRTEILDRLIKPINPEAVLRESFILVPGAPGYDVVSEANGMGAFDQVDIPGAQKLLADAGVTGPIDVRLLYAANNPRRSNEYDLMKASAQQAGFNLIDGQSPSWGTLLPTISGYDASLFGWQNTSTGHRRVAGELRHHRLEQLRQVHEPGGGHGLRHDHRWCAARRGALQAVVGHREAPGRRRFRNCHLPVPERDRLELHEGRRRLRSLAVAGRVVQLLGVDRSVTAVGRPDPLRPPVAGAAVSQHGKGCRLEIHGPAPSPLVGSSGESLFRCRQRHSGFSEIVLAQAECRYLGLESAYRRGVVRQHRRPRIAS